MSQYRSSEPSNDLAVESRRKSVEVPARGKRRPAYAYEVPEYQQENSTVVGTELDHSAIQSRIVEARTAQKGPGFYPTVFSLAGRFLAF